MSDRHVRRTGDDYASSLLDLLPQGIAWPRERDSVLERAIRGLAQCFGFVDKRAADLLEIESDPRLTIELLPEWERAWGLPDECFPTAHTIDERRKLLVLKMTLLGGQSRAFFFQVAELLGYTIKIREFSPFMCGVSQVGDTRDPTSEIDPTQFRWELGAPEMRFYWTVRVGLVSLTWFRVTSGQVGVDPHLRIGIAIDLECLINRWKPAHTRVVFDYSGLENHGSMAGTP